MIIDEVRLHNFCLYEGHQTIDVSPKSEMKPIILLGGLNGGGKTTILDAIQLALYGKLARCSSRGNLAYSAFLQRCIHHSADHSVGASVGLSFRHTVDGTEHTYSISRSWKNHGKGIRERSTVWIDGNHTPAEEEYWLDLMEMILPVRISHLFFFDSEQVLQFAEPNSASSLLSTAVHALLGVDLIDQLSSDLGVIERRYKASAASGDQKASIKSIETEIEELQDRVSRGVTEMAALRCVLDLLTSKLAENERLLEESGATRLEQRTGLENEHRKTIDELEHIENALRDIASGTFPMILVQNLLDRIRQQTARENDAHDVHITSLLLKDRDSSVLRTLGKVGATRKQIAEVDRILREDRSEREGRAQVDCYLDLFSNTETIIDELLSSDAPFSKKEAMELLTHEENLRNIELELESRLSAIPEYDVVASLFESRTQLRQELRSQQDALLMKEGEIGVLRKELARKKRSLSSVLEKIVDEKFKQHEGTRVARHSLRARSTLAAFRSRIIERHIGQLEGLILECFHQLARKQRLVSRIRIDPSNFTLDLYRADGRLQPMDRLSAGERQLLAVAVLWGLAKASGRQLPVVIDTPLGRLDSVHRTNLVQYYFPIVSRQVILLSTDKEIDQNQYVKMKSKIGRNYLLEYNECQDRTDVVEGYFW